MPRSSARPSPSLKLTHYGSLWKPVCAGGSTRTSGVTNERMRHLLADDCDAWLRERAIEPSPYSHVLAPGVYHLRLGNITDDQLPSSVLNALLDPQDSGVILQVTDWSRTQESLPTALSELASITREADTFERRGILFSAEERPALEASLAAVIAGAMSAYVHVPGARASIYVWEGEFMEGWFNMASTLERVARAATSESATVITRSDA